MSQRYPWTWTNQLEDAGFECIEEGTGVVLTAKDTHEQRHFVGDRFTWRQKFNIEGECNVYFICDVLLLTSAVRGKYGASSQLYDNGTS
jgi:hypothetical protein